MIIIDLRLQITNAANWWLRSANNATNFRNVNNNGNVNNNNASNSNGVALGFGRNKAVLNMVRC